MDKSFHVTWEIDLDGCDTARQAAEYAFDVMQRPGTTATCFLVQDSEGFKTYVDLQEGEERDPAI